MAVKKTYVNIEECIYNLVLNKEIDIVEAVLLSDIEHFSKAKGYFKRNEVIAKELNISKETVMRKIKKLEDLGYVVRTKIFRNRVINVSEKFKQYQQCQIDSVDIPECQNDMVKCQNDIVTECQNDIVNNRIKNIENNNIVDSYFSNNEVNVLFNDFLANRIELFGKKINTELSIKKLINKLNKYSNQDKIEMLDIAISRGYRDVFKQNEKGTKNNIPNNDYLDSL